MRDAIGPNHCVAVDDVRDKDVVGWLRVVEEEED